MKEIRTLTQIMARLRGPRGCPWDQKQTHKTLRPMLLEEVYELLEAIDQKDDEALQEELGDVLLHIIFHSQLAEERRAFNFQKVAKQLAEKLRACKLRTDPSLRVHENTRKLWPLSW